MNCADPATMAIHAAKCELFARTLRLWGEARLHVTGTSMVPAIWPGDVLVVRRERCARMQVGDIAVYLRAGRLFVHRVVQVIEHQDQCWLVTRGDSLQDDDPPVSESEFLGRVAAVSHRNWIIRLRTFLSATLPAAPAARS